MSHTEIRLYDCHCYAPIKTVKKLWEASKCSSFRSLDNSDLIACTVKTEDK